MKIGTAGVASPSSPAPAGHRLRYRQGPSSARCARRFDLRDEDERVEVRQPHASGPGPNDVLNTVRSNRVPSRSATLVAKAHFLGRTPDLVVNCAGPEVTFSELAETTTGSWRAALAQKCWTFIRSPRQPCRCSATPDGADHQQSPVRQRLTLIPTRRYRYHQSRRARVHQHLAARHAKKVLVNGRHPPA